MTSCFHGEYIKKTFIIWPKLSIPIHLQMGKLWNWTKGQKYYPFWRIQGWRANIHCNIGNIERPPTHTATQKRLTLEALQSEPTIFKHHSQWWKCKNSQNSAYRLKRSDFFENDPNYGRQRTLNLAVWRRFMEFVIRGHKILSNL